MYGVEDDIDAIPSQLSIETRPKRPGLSRHMRVRSYTTSCHAAGEAGCHLVQHLSTQKRPIDSASLTTCQRNAAPWSSHARAATGYPFLVDLREWLAVRLFLSHPHHHKHRRTGPDFSSTLECGELDDHDSDWVNWTRSCNVMISYLSSFVYTVLSFANPSQPLQIGAGRWGMRANIKHGYHLLLAGTPPEVEATRCKIPTVRPAAQRGSGQPARMH